MASMDSTQYRRNRLGQTDGRKKIRRTNNSRSHTRTVTPDPTMVHPDTPDYTYVHKQGTT